MQSTWATPTKYGNVRHCTTQALQLFCPVHYELWITEGNVEPSANRALTFTALEMQKQNSCCPGTYLRAMHRNWPFSINFTFNFKCEWHLVSHRFSSRWRLPRGWAQGKTPTTEKCTVHSLMPYIAKKYKIKWRKVKAAPILSTTP